MSIDFATPLHGAAARLAMRRLPRPQRALLSDLRNADESVRGRYAGFVCLLSVLYNAADRIVIAALPGAFRESPESHELLQGFECIVG